jgi:hypothetical protein
MVMRHLSIPNIGDVHARPDAGRVTVTQDRTAFEPCFMRLAPSRPVRRIARRTPKERHTGIRRAHCHGDQRITRAAHRQRRPGSPPSTRASSSSAFASSGSPNKGAGTNRLHRSDQAALRSVKAEVRTVTQQGLNKPLAGLLHRLALVLRAAAAGRTGPRPARSTHPTRRSST